MLSPAYERATIRDLWRLGTRRRQPPMDFVSPPLEDQRRMDSGLVRVLDPSGSRKMLPRKGLRRGYSAKSARRATGHLRHLEIAPILAGSLVGHILLVRDTPPITIIRNVHYPPFPESEKVITRPPESNRSHRRLRAAPWGYAPSLKFFAFKRSAFSLLFFFLLTVQEVTILCTVAQGRV